MGRLRVAYGGVENGAEAVVGSKESFTLELGWFLVARCMEIQHGDCSDQSDVGLSKSAALLCYI